MLGEPSEKVAGLACDRTFASLIADPGAKDVMPGARAGHHRYL